MIIKGIIVSSVSLVLVKGIIKLRSEKINLISLLEGEKD